MPQTEGRNVRRPDESGSAPPTASAQRQSEARAPALPDRVRRLLRYTGVNIVSVMVDYAIFLSLMPLLGMPVVASTIGHAVAFSLNYVLSRRLVFLTGGAQKGERRLFAEFMVTGILGLVLTAAVTAAGIYGLGLSPIVAKTMAMLLTFVTLYIIRSRLVFTPQD